MAKRYLGGGISFEQENVYQEFSKDGGGSSTLSGLTDVDISNPTDGQVLVYNVTAGKWENGAGGGGGGVHIIGAQNIESNTFLTVTAGQLYGWLQNNEYAVLVQSSGDGDYNFTPISGYGFDTQYGYGFKFGDNYWNAVDANDYPQVVR